MNLQGTVLEIGEEKTFNDGAFKKREFVIVIDEGTQYSQEVPIDVVQKNLSILNGVAPGDFVDVDINIRANKYQDKRFVSFAAWRLNILKKGSGVPVTQPATHEAPPQGSTAADVPDDLPF